MGKDGYDYYQYIDPVLGLIDIPHTQIDEKPKKKVTKKQKEYLPKNLYVYDGPVIQFDRCVISNFQASTLAVSLKQATNNILYKAKKELGLEASAGGFRLDSDVLKM